MRPTLPPARWEEARRWWLDGMSARQIAARLGRSTRTVHAYARAHGWPRGRHQGDAAPDRGHGYRAEIGVPHGARYAARHVSRLTEGMHGG